MWVYRSLSKIPNKGDFWVKYIIGGFHVTQVCFIITQVKNKIAYHLIN